MSSYLKTAIIQFAISFASLNPPFLVCYKLWFLKLWKFLPKCSIKFPIKMKCFTPSFFIIRSFFLNILESFNKHTGGMFGTVFADVQYNMNGFLRGKLNQGIRGFQNDPLSPKLQHYLNPLHIYCRLIDFGLPKTISKYLCRFYEKAVFKFYWLSTKIK